MTPEQILAVTSLAAAVFAGYNAYRTSQRAARRDEVQLLREEIYRLSARVQDQENQITVLRTENAMLHDEVNRLRDRNAEHQREIGVLQNERESLKTRVHELERLIGGPIGSVEESKS